MQGPSSKKGPRVNEDIEENEVRLIDETGENHGAVPIEKAIAMAKAASLDLVEISPNATPPVCKILDYGKYKYEAQKKASLARKKQKTVEVKEIKLRPGIEKHDYDVKMRAIEKFLSLGDKVKVTLRYRGREMAHMEIGMGVLERVREQFSGITKIEQAPKMEGRQMIMIIAPK
jgi:translation initiation factor IF-3